MGQIWAQHRSSVLLVRHVPESDELPPKVTILDREDGHAWADGCCCVRDPSKAPQGWTDVFKVLPAGSVCHQLSVQHTHFLSAPFAKHSAGVRRTAGPVRAKVDGASAAGELGL